MSQRTSRSFSLLRSIIVLSFLGLVGWTLEAAVPAFAETKKSAIADFSTSADTGLDADASQETFIRFSIDGVEHSQLLNSADITSNDSTPAAVVFEDIVPNKAIAAAQDLSVATNAKNGFVVTVQTAGQLETETGEDIDSFRNGSYDANPTAWVSPSATPGQENEYGHWGITSDDATLTESLTDLFNVLEGGDRFVAASSSPIEVLRHTGPIAGKVQGEGLARVGYKVEVSSLQENADKYQTAITYVVTPVF